MMTFHSALFLEACSQVMCTADARPLVDVFLVVKVSGLYSARWYGFVDHLPLLRQLVSKSIYCLAIELVIDALRGELLCAWVHSTEYFHGSLCQISCKVWAKNCCGRWADALIHSQSVWLLRDIIFYTWKELRFQLYNLPVVVLAPLVSNTLPLNFFQELYGWQPCTYWCITQHF